MELKCKVLFLVAYMYFVVQSKEPPEAHYTPLELILSNGYHGGENHNVTTPDGYILSLQRIPYGRNGKPNKTQPVIFLQHGLLCASTNWISNGPSDSLAFLLADAGFDVWLGNIRGNTYSRRHVKYNPDTDSDFWKFSFDEHALVDLPSMISYALSVSKQDKLYYVGHSQGTMMGFAGFSRNQTLANQINEFYALAPVSTVHYIKGMFRYLADNYKILVFFLNMSGTGELVPNDGIIDKLGELFCNTPIREVCSNILFLICGFDEKNLNDELLPVYLGHVPAGTSLKNLEHWSQLVKSGNFQMYDYGSKEANEAHYPGHDTPPSYNLTLLNVPTYLFAGAHDYLADPTDVSLLIPKISRVLKGVTNLSYYDHLDFIWGIDAGVKVYDVIINNILNKTIN